MIAALERQQQDTDTVGTTGHVLDLEGINHPRHYNLHPSGVEVKEVTNWMNFNCGSAFKYVLRRDLKDAQSKDLKKALWYLDEQLDLALHHKDCTSFPTSAQRALHRMIKAESSDTVKLFMISIFFYCLQGSRQELFDARCQVQRLLDMANGLTIIGM